jgi:hypothetical protein
MLCNAKQLILELINYFNTMDEFMLPYESGMLVSTISDFVTTISLSNLFYEVIGVGIALLSTLLIGMMLFIWRLRTSTIQKTKLKMVLRNQNVLSEWITGDDEVPASQAFSMPKATFIHLNGSDLSNPFKRNLFKEELLALRQTVVGSDTRRLRDLYLWLGFKAETVQRLKTSQNEVVLLDSLRELTLMNIQEGSDFALYHTRHRNPTVRIAAMREAIRSKKQGKQLDFLDTFQGELTDWEQSQLFSALNQCAPLDLPYFERWHQHSEPTIRAFATKMTAHFGTNALYSTPIAPKHLKKRPSLKPKKLHENVVPSLSPVY